MFYEFLPALYSVGFFIGLSIGPVTMIFYLHLLWCLLDGILPAYRALKPWKVWLCLVPVFSLVWHFVIVIAVAHSVRQLPEFANRRVRPVDWDGRRLGLTMCCFNLLAFVPNLGVLFLFAGLLAWVFYWKKILTLHWELQDSQVALAPTEGRRSDDRGYPTMSRAGWGE
ncbi:MAG: hypothetical protein K2X03_15610 [Bryobacteraceae bacterium]|nr:hypothetical protein [Bryobacteraceae bacterium]